MQKRPVVYRAFFYPHRKIKRAAMAAPLSIWMSDAFLNALKENPVN